MHIPVATWISRESVCHALSKIPQTAFVPVSDLLSIGWVTMKSVCCWLVLLSFLLLVQVHPRRPRGSQSGREKRRDESFHYGRKSPWVPTLTGPFPKIQADAGSWLGTKNALYYCAQSVNTLLSSFREFVHDGYCFATLARFAHQASASKGNLYFLLS